MCLTPEAQNEATFEVFFACAESNSERDLAIAKKYVDLASIDGDYDKRYKEKHGVDLGKHRAGHENDPNYVPPASDRDLLRDTVASHVKDKAGFFEAVARLSEGAPGPPLGDLEKLIVNGGTATGRAKIALPPKPGERPPTVHWLEKTFRFRRIDGGWLLNSQ